MDQIRQTAENILWNIFHRIGWAEMVDIFIVAIIIYALFRLVRQTRGSAVLKGLVLFLFIVAISNAVGLTALNWLLMNVVNNGTLVLVILFQPELRKALEQIGRSTRLKEHRGQSEDENSRIVSEIIRCCERLSRRKVGALIVFERKTGLQDVIETGINIDASVSAALLENIFEPNTPLHDGAVVVRGGRVTAAACILTLTEGQGVSHDLGTRHRAALGISETTDAMALIVSEETGIISIAQEGRLIRHLDGRALREKLQGVFGESVRFRLFRKNPKAPKAAKNDSGKEAAE